MRTVDTIGQIPGVQGGYPVIAGTRTPVRTIVEMYCVTHNGDIEAILESLPHLSHEQVEAALHYYKDRPDIIDEDIARQRRAWFAQHWP